MQRAGEMYPTLPSCIIRERSKARSRIAAATRAQPSTIVLFHCDSGCSTRRQVNAKVEKHPCLNARNLHWSKCMFRKRGQLLNHPEEKWFNSGENKRRGETATTTDEGGASGRAESFSVSSCRERRREEARSSSGDKREDGP